MHESDQPRHYRPQYHLRWRGIVRILDKFPRLKARLADRVRGVLHQVFSPGVVMTERVVEYPFVFQRINGSQGAVLDIGSVTSWLPIELASRGFRVVGMDIRPYPFTHPNLQAVRGDAMVIPFASGSFATVVAVSVIEHIGIGHFGDPLAEAGDLAVTKEIARVLQPNGRALITVPFGVSLTNGFQRVYDPPRLRELLSPLDVAHIEYAWSRQGQWTPCAEAQASSVDWNGPARAVALIVATAPHQKRA